MSTQTPQQVQAEDPGSRMQVEKPPLRPKKKLEMIDYLNKDAFVDAKDHVGEWRVGQIMEIDKRDNTAKVHFDGWSAKWDEVTAGEIASDLFLVVSILNEQTGAVPQIHDR